MSHPQCWSPTWLPQNLAVRSWSDNWNIWRGCCAMLRQTGLACSKSRLAQGFFVPQAVVDANTVLLELQTTTAFMNGFWAESSCVGRFCRIAFSFLYTFQVSVETADKHSVSEQAQLGKLERLEQEYLRLTHTQNNTEVHSKTHWIENYCLYDTNCPQHVWLLIKQVIPWRVISLKQNYIII